MECRSKPLAKEASKLCFSVNAVIHFNDMLNDVIILTSFNLFKDRVVKILLKDLPD